VSREAWSADILSSAKGVRKVLVSRGADEAQVKEHRKSIDAIVRLLR
jgi:hypothetical protein